MGINGHHRPSILLTGLRLNKALAECAPAEYDALNKAIEKLIESTSPDRPPASVPVNQLAILLADRTVVGSIRNLINLDDALEGFFDALFPFCKRCPDIAVLCRAITIYRSHLHPHD